MKTKFLFSIIKVDITALCSLLVILALVTTPVFASGFLPDPVVTDDPNGNVNIMLFYKVACEIYDKRFANGYTLEGVLGGVMIYDDTVNYRYYYYLQDLLDTCIAMRSI